MPKNYRAFITGFHTLGHTGGKITISALLSVALISVTSFGAFFELHIPTAFATPVSTSVNVLNTPPQWTVDAQESTESSTSTPTNAGTTLSFVATATDSSNDNYWLIICSASSTPTAHNNAPPTCSAGIQWAISATTTSASSTVAATSTIANAPFNVESNAWFAYVCDGNSTGAQCNTTVKQGTGLTVSPFVINHPPIFSAISNSGNVNPGAVETWTATATDTDLIRGGDTIKLIVCKAADYVGGGCGVGGTWASSTLAHFNPATSTTITIPAQDKTYNAFVYITDQNNLDATSTFQGSASNYVVNNVAPTVSSSTISILNATSSASNITLTVPNATSGPFFVTFTVTDNNGCQNASLGNEIVSATTSIYRSGVGQASCQLSGAYNTNSCYPSVNAQTQISCVQTSCVPGTTNAGWQCTFPLWYNADPTDTGSQFSAQNWLASVQVTDDNGALSPISESSTGNKVNSFLAFGMTKTSISYGGLQPGNNTGTLSTTTDLIAQGNVGLDENLYGDTMCTTWTTADSCDAGGVNAATKIPVLNQKFGTTSVAYGSAFATALTASTSPTNLGIHVNKTTSTSSPQTKNTFWGIAIPGTITLSGPYTGQNTVIATESNSAFW